MIEGITFAPPPFLFVVLGAIVGLAIGWVIGYVDSNNRTSKKIEVAEARADRAAREAEQKVAAAASEVVNVMDDPGLLRLTQRDNLPFLEMDGGALNIKSVTPEQRKRLIELLNHIRPWVENSQPMQPVAKPAPPPAPVSLQPASSFMPNPAQPLAPVKPAEEKDIRSLSIVAQIDSVLQAHLVETHLAGRGIRLTESAAGGVEVYVGLNKYPSIDDVPDFAIQNVIRSAIQEWEQKFTPGA
jgi:hypothetical protein